MFRKVLPALLIGSVLFVGAGPAVARPAEKMAKSTPMAVRDELIRLPYYNVFDWLEAETLPGGKVVLHGQVLRPTTRDDADFRVRRIEGVTEVINNIKVVQVSPSDDQLRLAIYRAVFSSNSTLYRYAIQAVPSIHIVVENGRAVLKGVVASDFDSRVAYTAARQVPGLLDVRNELRLEK